MLKTIAEESAKNFFGKLLEDLIGYWRIYDHLKITAKKYFNEIITIDTENEFWYSILKDNFNGEGKPKFKQLKFGQVVRLKNFFISEWAPKMPGQFWTLKGAEDYTEGMKHSDKFIEWRDKMYSVLDPYGKEKVLSSGFGSLRISPKTNNSDYCMYVSFVSPTNWHTDFGIPAVISKSVYYEMKKLNSSGAPWVEEAQALLVLYEDLPIKEFVPSAIGASLSHKSEEALRFKPFLPKCFLYISSPLDIKMKVNNSHPESIAWAMFETNSQSEPFKYTYASFSPNQGDSIMNSVEFINCYVRDYNGRRIITDFDGQIPRLESVIPINKDPQISKKNEFKAIIKRVDSWTENTLKKF